jgi:ABC-type transport system involved in multi-copper enzyme maturation permease subunit
MTATSPGEAVHAAAHKLFSFRRFAAIAGNTFRDLVRQKVFYFMVVFALILIGSSLVMAPLSFRGQLNTVMDVALGAMSLFTMLLAVLATAILLPRDLEERTLYTILAKPVSRFEYLLGKLAGVALMLFVATVAMTAAFCVVLLYWQGREIINIETYVERDKVDYAIAQLKAGTFTPTLFGGIGVILLRALVCAALTLMISAFSTSWLFTVVVAFMGIIIGHLVPVARTVWLDQSILGAEPPWYFGVFLRGITVFLPDMQLFNIVDDIAVGTVVPGSVFLSVLGLGAGYLAIYVLVAWLFFAWKEL